MSQPEVLVVRTGTANLASVCAGLSRIGATPRITQQAAHIESAERVVLPGVGAFGAALQTLREAGLCDVLRERITADRPTLAVCVGLQVLCESSEESPGVDGLGVVPGRVTRFADDLRAPQLGWNLVTPPDADGFEPGYAYFANSYKLDAAPAGWQSATANHGGPFVAALWRGRVLACQFHPELSGPWGLALLQRWLTANAAGGATC